MNYASYFLNFFCAAILVFASTAPVHAEIRDLPSLTVLAPPALSAPMTRITRHYALEAEITVMTSFLNAKQQWNVVQEGDAADVIITSDPSIIRRLKRQGLMDVFTSNRWIDESLFLITPNDWAQSPTPLPSFEQDTQLPWRDPMQAPNTNNITKDSLAYSQPIQNRMFLNLHKHLRSWLNQAPIYILADKDSYMDGLAQLSLESLQLQSNPTIRMEWFEDLEPLMRAYQKNQGNIIVPESSLHAMQQFLPSATANRGELPLPNNQQLTLYVAVVAGEHMELARQFVHYLKTPETRLLIHRKQLH